MLGDTKGLLPNVGLLVGIIVATLFRFWSYRKWVWTAPPASAPPPSRVLVNDPASPS